MKNITSGPEYSKECYVFEHVLFVILTYCGIYLSVSRGTDEVNKNLEILSKNHNSGGNGTFISPLSREKR